MQLKLALIIRKPEDQSHLQLLRIRNIITLAIQIIGIESPNSIQQLMIMLIHKLMISALPMPRIKRVIPNHSQPLLRNQRLIFNNMIKILIVTPSKHNILQPTPRRINAVLRTINRIVIILIILERLLAKDNPLIKGTTNSECITNNIPLPPSTEEEEQFA